MRCKDLKIVNLNINEDNYEYQAYFRLCSEDVCIEVDLEQLESMEMMRKIKGSFSIDETVDEMKEIIMEKIMEASRLESRNSEGENCCKAVDEKTAQRKIDSLSIS